MEGTSGAADFEPLRGGSNEAALGSGCTSRKQGASWATRAPLALTRGLSRSRAGDSGCARRGRRRRIVAARFGERRRSPRCIRFSTGCAAIARQEVSERIGLGRSSRRGRVFGRAQRIRVYHVARARRQTRGADGESLRPLTRETSAGEHGESGGSLGFHRRVLALFGPQGTGGVGA